MKEWAEGRGRIEMSLELLFPSCAIAAGPSRRANHVACSWRIL